MASRLIYILLILACVCAPVHGATQDSAPFTVVIDPGHGGKDYGCEGKLTNEKTIVLDVARRVGKIIGENHPEVNVVYTRDNDRFISLSDRASIANKAHADLFISIHVNSIDRRTRGREKVHGASVYTLGLHRNDDNLAVAMRENSVIELENDFTETYQGFDPNSSESYIIFELTQNRHQRNSIEFAESVRDELVSTAGRADKGVRQSGFLVLRATSMPSVLVELDFICNPDAEQYLNSEEGRENCAKSIAKAFQSYYGRHGSAKAPAATSRPATQVAAEQGSSQQGQLIYAVQFLTSEHPIDSSDSRLQQLSEVSSYQHDNLYKYVSGSFSTLKQAKKHLRKVQKIYPEAFIIKMCDGVRIL